VELWVYRHYCAGGLWFYLEEDGRPWRYIYPDDVYELAESTVEAIVAGWGGWWMDCADADEVAAQEAAVQRGHRLDATGFWDD
jgi:hypothetical protein